MTEIEMSIVVPAYNEGEVIPKLISRLQDIIDVLNINYEILVVDDGSTDDTEVVLGHLAAHNANVVPIFLSRNFGKESALTAGLAASHGQCIIFIDADLQHPPELIPKMYEYWKGGYDVINAIKRQRGNESFLYKYMAKQFNNIMTQAIGQNMSGASDFMLIDRQVADVVISCAEKNRFFRGLVAWAGFKVKKIEFDVQERTLGISKWSTLSLVRYSINNILSFSAMPLRIVGYVGIFTAILGILLLIQTLVRYALGQSAIGFTTVIAVQVLLGGMILVALGVVSIYLSGMYYEQKNRPIFIVRNSRQKPVQEKNFDEGDSLSLVALDSGKSLTEIDDAKRKEIGNIYRNSFFLFVLVSSILHFPHFYSHIGDINFDFFIHYNWAKEFSENLSFDSLYPRWTFHGSLDLGEPAFIFYSPLYYLSTALLTKLGITAWNAMHVVEILSNAIFGWFVFKTTSYYTSNKIALFAGSLALVNPFLVMLHYKFHGFAWASVGYASHGLLLWSLLRPNVRHDQLNLPASIAIALSIYSHTISALVNLIIFSAVIFFQNEGRPVTNYQSFLRVVAAWGSTVLIGLALSVYYLGPAFYFMKDITTQAWSGDHILQAFAWPTFTAWLHGVQWFSFQWPIAIPALAIFIFNLIYFVKIKRKNDLEYYKTPHLKILCIMSVAVFFASELSYILWRIDSPLLKIQLPYRFVSVLYVVGIIASSIALSESKRNDESTWVKIFTSLLLLTAFTGLSVLVKSTYFDGKQLPVALTENDYTYRDFERNFKNSDGNCNQGQETCRAISLQAGGYRGVPEYKLKWRGKDSEAYAKKGFAGECESLHSDCKLVEQDGNKRVWQINTPDDISIRLPVYYFPSWKVYVDAVEVSNKYDQSTGLIKIPLSRGIHSVSIIWQETQAERYSKYVTIMAVLGLFWYASSRKHS